MKLDLWGAPYLLSSRLPDWYDATLKNEDGETMVYYSVWRHGDAGCLPLAERLEIYALDPSLPEIQACEIRQYRGTS